MSYLKQLPWVGAEPTGYAEDLGMGNGVTFLITDAGILITWVHEGFDQPNHVALIPYLPYWRIKVDQHAFCLKIMAAYGYEPAPT